MSVIKPQANDIFVFGSNLAGRHGKGAAFSAKKWYGATQGQGEGLSGQSYALPTKDERLTTLPLDVIEQYVDRFKAFAAQRPDLVFHLTPIGCGLAGYSVAQIAPLFADATENVQLPGVFKQYLGDSTLRIIVAGGRDYDNRDFLFAVMDKVLRSTDHPVEIISGTARGCDALGADYAKTHNLRLVEMPAAWDYFGKAAGAERNWRMAQRATHLVAFWDGQSRGTHQMIDAAKSYGLTYRVVRYALA